MRDNQAFISGWFAVQIAMLTDENTALRAEIDRLRRILAALREPSEAMVADAAEYVLGYHEPDYRDIRTAIRAAVAAAEQEVGRE